MQPGDMDAGFSRANLPSVRFLTNTRRSVSFLGRSGAKRGIWIPARSVRRRARARGGDEIHGDRRAGVFRLLFAHHSYAIAGPAMVGPGGDAPSPNSKQGHSDRQA
jgi:hypothetical protein